MTPLALKLAARIRADGPVSIATFMQACLADPEHGYYLRQEPFGAGGDFVTAPEVSQMFGELIGAWAVTVWERMGAPARVVLAELGPGRGTLMADLLRVARLRPAFLEAASLHLVETSRRLRDLQGRAVTPSGMVPHFHDRFEDLPEGPLILVANEFFDALPIRQFLRGEAGWNERMVGLDAEGRLAFGLMPLAAMPPDADERLVADAHPGAILEINRPALAVMSAIAARIAAEGGAALAIDYGHAEPGYGDTLQAVSRHRHADVLETAGEADLTAHIDFAALSKAARSAGARAFPVIGQGAFLGALGLAERAEALAARADPAHRAAVEAAAGRLVGPQAMGELFKVLVIANPAITPPPFDLSDPLPQRPQP